MTVELFPALDPEYDLEAEAPTKVLIDCPTCGGTDALMRGWYLGKAAFQCLECRDVWVGEPVEPDVCDTGLGGSMHCGLPTGHDETCAPDLGFTTVNIPVVIAAAVLLSLIPNVLVTAVGMVGLVGWLAFGRSRIREEA